MKIYVAAVILSVLATLALAMPMPSGVEVVYHEPHHEENFLGSLSHVLKVTSHLLHKTANLGGGLGALLHSSNLAAHGHEHHHVVAHAAPAEQVYVSDHSAVYPSAHPPVVSTYSSLHNEV